jgi:hypothetical protein
MDQLTALTSALGVTNISKGHLMSLPKVLQAGRAPMKRLEWVAAVIRKSVPKS